MRARSRFIAIALIGLAGAAACGDDPRIVLELTGAAPGADRVEVMLLHPLVLAKLQRHNDPQRNNEPALEPVFYLAERASARFELAGAPLDKLQLEIQDAGGPYVPLAVALAADRVLAMGIYHPESVVAAKLGEEHTPSVVRPVRDVTIYPIELEPVAMVSAPGPAPLEPPAVAPGQVMPVLCGDTLSGFAWRRGDRHQLRVLTASAVSPGAEDRLDPPDLDCDEHSPGPGAIPRHDAGDQRDCDDTVASIHGGARERCSTKLDDDCNPGTTLERVPCGQVPCATDVCVCSEANPDGACVEPVTPQACVVPAESVSGPGLKPCTSEGLIKIVACNNAPCMATLAVVPEGLELFLSQPSGMSRYGLGEPAPLEDGSARLTVHGKRAFAAPMLEPVVLRIATSQGVVIHTLLLRLEGTGGACMSPSEIVCPP